jgi:DNA-binding NtrC family response regulator
MGMKSHNQKASVRGKALLVDENPEGHESCRTILEAYGYQVRRCSPYQEGIRCLGDEVFHFASVCQGTPNLEGSCVLMRATEVNAGLPVLIVTRCVDIECYQEAMELGEMDSLVKPLRAWEIGRC